MHLYCLPQATKGLIGQCLSNQQQGTDQQPPPSSTSDHQFEVEVETAAVPAEPANTQQEEYDTVRDRHGLLC